MTMPKDPVEAEATRRKMRENALKQFSDPETYKKMSESHKKENLSEAALKNMSEAAKKRFEDPEERKKQSDRRKEYFEDNPDAGKKHGETLTKYYEDPEVRKKNGEVIKKGWESPEVRKRASESAKKRFETLGAKEKQSGITKKYYVDHQWYGSVKYYDSPQYCEKWTPDLRERVRAWFDYTCMECGTIQNGRRLHVHHVWYNKRLCCDDTPRSLVPLCPACHSKTSNVKGKKREEFSIHFQEIIDTNYGGRCWMTRDEFMEFEKNK